MNRQLFIDQILESENLTDELEDSDARWLINWGVSSLDPILSGITNEELAWDKVTALLSVIRKINRISGGPLPTEPELIVSDLVILSRFFVKAFSQIQQPDDVICLNAARKLVKLKSPAEKIMFLTHWGCSPNDIF